MNCPHCKSLLSEPDVLSGCCPACGAPLPPDLPEGVSDDRDHQTPGSGTVEGRPGLGTVQSDSFSSDDGGPAETPRADSEDSETNKTVVDRVGSQTVEAFTTPDSESNRDAERPAGGGTVTDSTDSADASEVTELPDTPGDEEADETGPPRTGTVIDRSISRTTINPQHEGVTEKTGTVDDRGFRTLDSVIFEDPGPGATQQRDSSGTLDSGEVAAEQARSLNELWGAGATENVSPRMTIRGPERGSSASRESALVIQSRAIRESETELEVEQPSADYDLLNKLGEGGMGVVYMARQASIDRTVAVKMLKPKASTDKTQKSKFLAEAVITGDLEHPNIVPIYDLGKNDDGALFYSMKRVKGTPWDQTIKKLSLVENLEILMKVCDAVAFSHSRGIIHRDLKPENTMLGDYGEVLVMDWGLALPFGRHPKSQMGQKPGMGGTPAYMAPEMATGPFNKLGPTSDVYLLGAILFECITGRPPHSGKDVMKCLFAAARNRIVETEHSGELLDIALKAMSTAIEDRFASVADFQKALRDYQEHSDSIAMAARAQEELEEAQQSDDYEAYAKALFGFQEALNLWSGNVRAERGVGSAKLAYADNAYAKGDFDLGLSLLDPDNDEHVQLKKKIFKARRARNARQRTLKLAMRAIYGLAAAILAVVSVALFVVNQQKNEVEKQRTLAVSNYNEAEKQRGIAYENAVEARENEREALEQKGRAEESAAEAREQRRIADDNAQEARAQEQLAVRNAHEARQQRAIAESQRDKAEYEAYVASIGAAAAKIDQNAFVDARALLTSEVCKPELRGWEWGRLMHLCDQMLREFDPGAPVETVAVSPDSRLIASGGWNGLATIWDLQSGRELARLQHDGLYVYGVAFSPDGKLLATGSNDPAGFIRLWDVASGKPVATPMIGHTDAVSSVQFSPSGRWLVSTSFDNTARVWDVSDPTAPQGGRVFRGHNWWLWDAAFSPDERQIATASQDGTVVLWDLESGKPSTPFTGHEGPVYTVAYAAGGSTVVSGGYDQRVLAWRPADLREYDFESLLAGETPAPTPFRELLGHTGAVRSVAIVAHTPNQLIASAGHDNTIRLWDLATGSLRQTMRGHGSWVRDCTFSADAQYVVSGAYDTARPVKLWRIDGYEEERVLRGRVLEGHFDSIMSAAFSPNGDRVVTAARDRTARVWSTRSGHQLVSFEEGHDFLASSAMLFADDKRLLTAAVDNTARVWDVARGVELLTLQRTGRAAAAVASANGKWLMTGSDRRTALLWNAASGDLIHELKGHDHEVTAVAIADNGKHLASGDANGRCILWDRLSGQPLGTLTWHTGKITALAFLPGGRWLVTASDDKTVTRWDLTGNPPAEPDASWILKHPHSVLSLGVSENGKLVLTTAGDDQVRLWDVAGGKVLREFEPGTGVSSAALSPSGRRALVVRENQVRLWDLETNREVLSPADNDAFLSKDVAGQVWSASFSGDGRRAVTIGGNEARLWDLTAGAAGSREMMIFSPHAALASASFSPDGASVVTASWDSSARIWDATTGSATLRLSGEHRGYVNSASFSPDGRLVLTASDDGTAKLWNAETGEVVGSLDGHEGPVHRAVFAPDGRLVVTASRDKTARIWETATAREVAVLTGHEWGVLDAAFSADGGRVVTGSRDNTARVWDVASATAVAVLAGHSAAVNSVAFSPDGRRVLTASADSTAKVWDAANGKEILNLQGHTREVTSAVFSADSRLALTGSRDGTAIVWLAEPWDR